MNVIAIVNKRVSTLLALLLVLSLTTACGFKLRGNYLLHEQLQTLHVRADDQHGELARLVKQQLSINNVNIKPNLSSDAPVLRLQKDALSRRTLSLFKNGQVAEYELIYTVKYQLIFPNENPLNFQFELNRDYQDDPDRALAKGRELDLILGELRVLAADKILRDLASIQR